MKLRKERLIRIGGLGEDECWGCVNYMEDTGKKQLTVVRECTCAPPDPVQRAIVPPSLEEILMRLSCQG